MKPIQLEIKTYDELKEELGNKYDTAMYEINISALKEIERLNNIIKRLEEDLREMYLTFGEFSEEYTENRIKELKGDGSNE